MKKTIILLLSLVTLIGASACGQSPSSIPSPTVAPTPTPPPLPDMEPPLVRDWDGVRVETICLDMEEDFPQFEGGVGKDRGVERILSEIGMRIVTDESPCDATFTITISGQAYSGTYYSGSKSFTCYTGAEIEGHMTLTAEGQTPLTSPISASRSTVGVTSELWCAQHQHPKDYPFTELYFEQGLDFLATLWGPRVLVAALGIGNDAEYASEKLKEAGPTDDVINGLIILMADEIAHPGRYRAAEMLGEFAPESEEAIPFLIQALRDEYSMLRRRAAEALGEFGPKALDALPALAQLYNEGDAIERRVASEAIQKINPD